MAKIYIDFTIRSQSHDIDFTELIGIKKNSLSCHLIGDRTIRGHILDYSQWSCNFPAYNDNNLSKICSDFYDKIYPKKNEIISEIIKISGEISICIVIDCKKYEKLSLSFDYQFLKLCNDLHATLDTDGIYQEKYIIIRGF